jgi:hypothetical protein
MFIALTLLAAFRQSGPLAGEPKLVTPITVRSEAKTLESLLTDVGEATGVKLSASNAIKQDRIVLYAEQRPAAETLQTIADHFGWTWQRNGSGFQLARTPQQEKAEMAGARRALISIYDPWRSRAKAAMQEKAGPHDQADYDAAIEANADLLARYNAEYYGNEPAVREKWIKEENANEAKRATLARRLSPVWRLHDVLIANLTDEDFLDLDRSSKLVFSYAPTGWQRPLPPAARAAAEAMVNQVAVESANRDRQPTSYERQRDLLVESYKTFRAIDVATVRVVIKRDYLIDPGEYRFSPEVTIVLLDKTGAKLSSKLVSERSDPTPLPAPKVDQNRPKDVLDEPIMATEELTAANASIDGRGYTLDECVALRAEFLKVGSKATPLTAEAKDLVEFAKAAHFNFVSDIFDRGEWLAGMPIPMSTPRAALDQLKKRLHWNWEFKDSWVKARAENWEFWRAITIRPSDIFAIRDKMVSEKGSFDATAEVALKISDRQTRDALFAALLPRSGGWQLGEWDLKPLYLARFWGVEPLEVRRRLLAGESLTFGSLPASARQYLSDFVFRHDQRDYETSIYGYGKEAEIEKPDVDWMKQSWPDYPSSPKIEADYEPTQRLPDGVPMETLVSVHGSQGHALIVSNTRGWSMAMTEQMAITSGYYQTDSLRDYLVRPAVDDRMFFTLRFGENAAIGLELSSISAVPGTAPKNYTELPDDIQTRLLTGYKARHGG